jgi:twitching motility protein PilT
MIDIQNLLKEMVTVKASDLHIKAPTGPIFRIDGALTQTDKFQQQQVNPEDVEQVFDQITTETQRKTFFETNELDFAYGVPGLARFRVNVQRQRNSLSMVFRLIPFRIPDIDELGLPQILKELMMKPRGLIVVTGPTGSGKSTTQAAMVDHLNNTRRSRVITIEDPIEYMYKDNLCVISQRELGEDTNSFDTALKHALRHDPDVIVVGEMRDLETMSMAIAAAETGHLVLGTLHTIDAPQTVDRMIGMFPSQQHQQVRLQFSQILVAVVSQALLPRASGKGRIGAFEIMLATPAVSNLIREGKTFELPSIMLMSKSIGMQTLDEDLASLVNGGIVTQEDAMLKTSHRERLAKLIEMNP